MTIFLNLIMKNEQVVLPRLLNSVWPILDGYCIVDTGSSDSSKEIVREFFDGKNIPGEIFDYPFTNFSDVRNFAISKIKGKADFGFLIDADEELVIQDGFDLAKFKKELGKHDVGMNIVNYGIRYGRKTFFRTSKPFRWEGAVHELLVCDSPTTTYTIEGLETIVHPDGHSWTSQSQKEKYLGHAKILEEEVSKSNKTRDIFYAAQSYRDAGEHEKSIEWYKKRVERTDGFGEERYFSQYTIGNLYRDIEKYPESILEYMRCFDLDDMRAEHLTNLITELQEQKCHQVAYMFSKYGMEKYYGKNPYPSRVLFLNEGAYDNTLLALHLRNCKVLGKSEDVKYLRGKMTIDEFFNSVTSAWIGYREFAKWLVEEMNPSVTVDLGVDYGYSTYALAMGNKGKVYGIDHFEGDPFTGIRNTREFVMDSLEYLKQKGISNIEIISGNFDRVALGWKKKIDILHIDEVPTEIKKDYDTWGKFVKDNGVILLHNTQAFPEVKEFFNRLDLPKYEFSHSGGLGVVSKNRDIIQKIKDKYSPDPTSEYKIIPKEKITIAYISHNKEVFDKYLGPSLKSLSGIFEVINVSSAEGMPASNYNKMLEMAKTKYVLFVHEDVTFSPDFLHRIHMAINNHPDFGAMGTVGNYNNDIEWGVSGKIREVITCDGCCVLVNKNHNLKFDSTTFDEYHLYVDDMFLQCRNKGLKNYTIPTNAYEAHRDDTYQDYGTYFRHHSHTVNQRGYCWGKYYEYLKKMNSKWSGMGETSVPVLDAEVDVCIISYAKTEELQKITRDGIKTLLESESTIKFNVFVVESNREVNYNHYPNTRTIYPEDRKFGYHKYMNLAIKEGKAEFVFLANNDLTYVEGWASVIIAEMRKNPGLMSASPLCPQTQNRVGFPNEIYYGYRVRGELAGWAIFVQRKIFNIIGQLDESIKYWFSDNSYSMTLQKYGILHALVTRAAVNHHEKDHGKTGELILQDPTLMDEYTNGQYKIFAKKWNLIPA